jgi:hypothetical protein
MRRRRSERTCAVREAREHRRHVAEAREPELRERGRTNVREQCTGAPAARRASTTRRRRERSTGGPGGGALRRTHQHRGYGESKILDEGSGFDEAAVCEAEAVLDSEEVTA